MAIGTRLIEWVGAKSIFADPVFQYRRTAGLISDDQMRVLRAAASKSIFRVDGASARVLRPGDPPGLKHEYKWGPEKGNYVQRVDPDDWELIRACRSAKEFRDVTDGIPEESPIALPGELIVVKEEQFQSTRDYLNAFRRGR